MATSGTTVTFPSPVTQIPVFCWLKIIPVLGDNPTGVLSGEGIKLHPLTPAIITTRAKQAINAEFLFISHLLTYYNGKTKF
jgi:hypothetical protein